MKLEPNYIEEKNIEYIKRFTSNHSNNGTGYWRDEQARQIRFDRVTNLLSFNNENNDTNCSILDVGCGNADLYFNLCKKYPLINYYGVDYFEDGIEQAKKNLNQYVNIKLIKGGAVENLNKFDSLDYAVVHGVLAFKIGLSNKEFKDYVKDIITTLFNKVNKGLVFNLWTNEVDYYDEELYYENPLVTYAWCKQLTSKLILDEFNPKEKMYDYRMFLYK